MAWSKAPEEAPLIPSAGAAVSYPAASAPPGGVPAPSAPEASPSEWKAAHNPPAENNASGSGAVPSGSGPGTAEELDPEALRAAMNQDTNAAVAGNVDFVAIGIPSELKISNPSTPHYRSALLSGLLWGALGFFIYTRFIADPDPQSSCTSGYCNDDDYAQSDMGSWSMWPLVGVYVLYIIESCCSDSRKYMWNFKDVTDAEAFMGGLTESPPHIAMRGECYHYETRFRTITSTDSNGNTTTRTETYTVRVTTFTTTEYFEYSAWRDDSGPFHGMTLHSIVKLRLYKLVVWNDDESYRRFLRAYAHFQARHRWRDTHFSHSWDMRISGFKTNVLALSDPRAQPWWMSLRCYAAWSLLGLTWCWRRLLTSSSVEAKFTFRKIIRA